MNTKGYLGLTQECAKYISYFTSRVDTPYIVDEMLRETPIIPDYSISPLQNGMGHCTYFTPAKNYPNGMHINISKKDYESYLYIRNNAFYTPYGMMVKLLTGYNCTNSFELIDDSLIPKQRQIEFADNIPGCIKGFQYPNNTISVAFFSDFVMENILMKKVDIALCDCYKAFNQKGPNFLAVLMKRVIPQLKVIPEYDVQFRDMMLFIDKMDYDMYMIALTRYLSGDTITGRYMKMYVNKVNNAVYCRPVAPMHNVSLKSYFDQNKTGVESKSKNKKKG